MLDYLFLSDIESSLIQVLLALGIAIIIPLFFDARNSWHRSAIFTVAGMLALRYLWWRATQTIAPAGLTWDCLASWSLLALEMLSVVSSLSSFVILSRVRHRGDEATAQINWWDAATPPRVAILITTYNEELEVLERTIVGAKALNHPNKEVLVLDDGRRDWLHEYCESQDVRYVSRNDNAGSKAGNINNALQLLAHDAVPPDYVAVLDADFVPHRGFVARSLALFKEPKIGLVQTPQHFFNADPVQHNLGVSRSYPDEQRFFFDHLQPARDAWGIAFCCGTSSVLRWQAVQDVGGFPTESITEDFMMTLVLRESGWDTAYLDEPLTEGLAPEGLKEYVTQRSRWCLGMMQIARSRVGPFARNNLRLRDRWSVIDAVLYWLSTFLFRLATVTYPLLYWYFNITVVNAEVADVIGYFGVYYLWILLAMNSVARGMVIPVLNDVSQILGAIPIAKSAIVGLIQPHDHPFKVTAKGGDRSRIIIQWKLLRPYMILLLLSIGGLLIGIFSDQFAFNDAGQGKTVVLFWTLYNVLVLSMTLITFVELPRKERHIADEPEKTSLVVDGMPLPVLVKSLTQDTLRYEGLPHPLGVVGTIKLHNVGDVLVTVIAKTKNGARLRLQTTPAQKEALILRFYADGGSPGVARASAVALTKDLARRLSFNP
jgi:cellulose synthase (UDP-forming)